MAETIELEAGNDHVGEVFRGEITGQPSIDPIQGGAILTFPVNVTEKSETGDYKDPQFQNGISFKAAVKLMARRQDAIKGMLAGNLASIGYYGTLSGVPSHTFKGTKVTIKGFAGSDKFPDGSWYFAGWRSQEPLNAESVATLLQGLEDANEKGKDRKRTKKDGDNPF